MIRKWRELIDADRTRAEVGLRDDERQAVKPGRLVELFKQAGVWQVMHGRKGGKGPWKVASCVSISHIATRSGTEAGPVYDSGIVAHR